MKEILSLLTKTAKFKSFIKLIKAYYHNLERCS
jgi:hypothetical protein